MLEIRGLTKSYNGQEVLRNINYLFKENKVYFIVGESGCGKTTFLKIIAGQEENYEGIVLYKGNDIKQLNKKEKADYYTGGVSYLSQFPVCLLDLNVGENLSIPFFVNRKTTQNIGTFLNKLKKRKKTKRLSVGEKQRVCAQRIMNQNANIILADEPTAALDYEYKNEVLKELVKRAKGKILIVVSHDVELAKMYADEIIEIKKGHIKSNINKSKMSCFQIEKANRNISLFNAFKFARKLYKSEKKKSLLYNYSLVVGIVLISFTTMLSSGMMNYFQRELLKDSAQSVIEFQYDYVELDQDELSELYSEIGFFYFDFLYKVEDVFSNIIVNNKQIDVPACGLVNYRLNKLLNENEIIINVDEITNLKISEILRLDVLGLDFVQYINEFNPEITISLYNEEITIEKKLKAVSACFSGDQQLVFEYNNLEMKNEFVSKFVLDYELFYNGRVDDNLIDYLQNQDKYFYYEEKLYKHLGGSLVDKTQVVSEWYLEYGNVDFDICKLSISNIDEASFVFSNNLPLFGRPPEKRNEIVVSTLLFNRLYNEEFSSKDLNIRYREKDISFYIVGIIDSDELKIYYNQLNYEYLLDEFNSFENYKLFPVKETLFLKENLEYNQLLSFANKQSNKIDSSLIEVLQGMLPTFQGIEMIMKIFSVFTLVISVVTLFVLTILDFESKKKEYQMLKQTGYKDGDFIKLNLFKSLFSEIFVIITSVLTIEWLKILMNTFLGYNLQINSMFSGYDYLFNILKYVLFSFVLSNIIFILYTKRLTKN